MYREEKNLLSMGAVPCSVGFSLSLFIAHNEGLKMNISPSFQ